VIHIVANNQIGFTTTPAEARTGLYCTNVAKSIQAPIIHVNADEPELINKLITLAVAYRQQFKKDIFIDIIGYRRYGHNEQDQPAFTQPMMYQEISKRPPLYNLYSEKLIK
jgi:2-oxoglutarate dehydrogenase E1 component